MIRILFLILLTMIGVAGLPAIASAAVSISEIAWMGTVDSANYEWLELHNDGATAVDVTNWSITAGDSFSITLAGSIPGDSYVVLERNRSSGAYITSEPFLVYTGALVNTGVTLTLFNDGGDIVDLVADDTSVDGWDVGGDNTTKDTAQHTARGWGTGKPTPEAANTTAVTEVVVDTESEERPVAVSTGNNVLFPKSSESVRLTLADVELQLSTDIQKVATVGQVVPMEVQASGVGDVVINSLVYRWNFGDGYATSGVKKVAHAYSFPGTYVVTVEASYLRHKQIAEHTITVLPATFSITQNIAGDIQINNDAPYAVDISGYTLAADRSFTFPARTIIAPKATVTISHYQVLQEMGSDIALYDVSRRVVATLWPTNQDAADVENLSRVTLRTEPVSQIPAGENFMFSGGAQFLSEATASVATAIPGVVTNTQAPNPSPMYPWWPYILGMLVVGCGVAAVLVPKQLRDSDEPSVAGFFTPPIDESVK